MNRYCLYCDTLIQLEMTWEKLFLPSAEHLLCKTCLEKLQLITGSRCEICSRSLTALDPQYTSDAKCMDCIRWERDPRWTGVLENNISIYEYNDFLKEIIARYKFRGDYELAKAFAPEIQAAITPLTFDFLVPIPLSPERLLERGFNQSTGLAEAAGLKTNDILVRLHSEKQSKKSRRDRIHGEQIFQLTIDLTGKKVLLIDDIYTTGATIRQAAKRLKVAGAESVLAITLARG